MYEPLSDISLDLLDAQASDKLKEMNRRIFSHIIETKEFLYWCEKVSQWSDWELIEQVTENKHLYSTEKLTFLLNQIKDRKCYWQYKKEMILNVFSFTKYSS